MGLQTSADDVFIMDLIEELPQSLHLKSKSLSSEFELEKGLLFPLVSGTDVNRYAPLPSRQYILFPYQVEEESFKLITLEEISEKYPKIYEYLSKNKHRLEEREKGKFKGDFWHRFGRNQNIGIQSRVKLCVPRLVNELYASYDTEGHHFLDNVDVGGITLKSKYSKQGLQYLLGILNSSLMKWYFPFVSAPFRGGWMSANRQFLSQLPIRTIDFYNPADVARHDRMVELVQSMLDLHRQLSSPGPEHERTLIVRRIEAADRQIDRLVYELYGLTEEEIGIVEAASM